MPFSLLRWRGDGLVQIFNPTPQIAGFFSGKKEVIYVSMKNVLNKLARAANRAEGGVVYDRGSHPDPVIPKGEDLKIYIDKMSGSSSSAVDWERLGVALTILGLSEAHQLWSDLREVKANRQAELEQGRTRREMSW